MIEVELQISDRFEPEIVLRVVEQVCTLNELTCNLKGTLASYPGSVHWHFKQDKQRGILEITWWEREHRLWFKVASGRTSDWIIKRMPRLKEQIENLLL